MRHIKITNENGITETFLDKGCIWLLNQVEGIYKMEANVTMSDNTMIDGSTYQGSILNKRNIVMTLSEWEQNATHQEARQQLYLLFPPKTRGTFEHFENDIALEIDYYVENIEITNVDHIRVATVSLLCANPYFRNQNQSYVPMAGERGNFTFPHRFPPQGEAFSSLFRETLKQIDIENSADNVGMEIDIQVLGTVRNIRFNLLETNEHITLGYSGNPLTLYAGDNVKIITETEDENVYLIRNGVKEKINRYLDNDSEFLKLRIGTNTLTYEAESGLQNLFVTIKYNLYYLGA